jgi:pseudouridine synthase
MSNKVRIHQFLSSTGIFKSKGAVFDALKKSEVKIDGRIVTVSNFQLNPNTRVVTWKDKPLTAVAEAIYIILNKPMGYLSTKLTRSDAGLGKRSMFDLFSKNFSETENNSLFAVGRLDEDTSGLIIVTNDGKLGSRLTQPTHEIAKTYEAEIEEPLAPFDQEQIEKGITIVLEEDGRFEEYTTVPCKIIVDKKKPDKIKITISEGKKREIRRMFEKISNKVMTLKRISIGNLVLGDNIKLKEGELKKVTKEEIEKLIF